MSSLSRYTPALLRERALAVPNARAGLLRRGFEMTARFALLFSSLAWDKFTGQSNLPSRVQQRAAELRHGPHRVEARGVGTPRICALRRPLCHVARAMVCVPVCGLQNVWHA